MKAGEKRENGWCAELWLGDLDQLKTGREEEQEDMNLAVGQHSWWLARISFFKQLL